MKKFMNIIMTVIMCMALTTTFTVESARASEGAYSAAKRLIGMSEKTNRKQLKKMLGADPRKTPWCSLFVGYTMKQAGKSVPKSVNGFAKSWRNFGKAVSLKSAKRGDVVVVRTKRGYHVGLFDSFQGKRVALLGGNQSNRVKLSTYSIKSIVAVRR